MHLFYTPDIAPDSREYTLNEEESKHCVRVLRLGIGATIVLIDGMGNYFDCEIINDHPKRTVVRVVSQQSGYGKRNHYLHLAVAPTKNMDRFEWFLEKATEIGIDEVTPLICEHSERKDIKWDRLNKVISAAVKQSLTAYHPKLNEITKLSDFLKGMKQNTQRFIAHCVDQEKDTLQQLLLPKADYCVLIGPEGDFSPQEINDAIAIGYQPISLGNKRLRTETAALYACMEINLLNRA